MRRKQGNSERPVYRTRGPFAQVRWRGVPNWYGGEQLRSLLERSWCQAFDAVGLRWSYEPVRHCEGSVSYLVDFYLPDLDAYAEVKPVFPTWPEIFSAKLLAEWSRLPVYFLVGYPARGECYRLVPRHVGRHRFSTWEEAAPLV